MHDTKTISIKEYVARYTIVIFLVIFIASLLHYLVYSRYLHDLQENEYQKTLIQSANSVSRSLKFYQSVVDELASQHAVIDLLQFGTNEDTQKWANQMQRLLPESIGLALFDINANVKGLRGELRLSDRCIADMGLKYKSKLLARPPVHYKITALAHYDISSPIIIEGEKIGVVFASFSLQTVKRLLSGLQGNNQALKITTSDGIEVASVGDLTNKGVEVKTYSKVIENTDWKIELFVTDVKDNVLVTTLLISNIVAFFLLSLTLYFAIKRLFNVVVLDFESLSWLMQKIRNGTYDSKDECHISLKETNNVFKFIQHTAKELNAYQIKLMADSTTDELTGLFNRRALNDEIDKCLELANHNHKLYMLVLDLDDFKIINDTHGHEVGDSVLKIFAKGLKEGCKTSDICTRAGGDEFIVILSAYEQEEIKHWFTNLCDFMALNIQQYNAENNLLLKFGVSCGATFIRNNDLKSAVLKRADDALYKVKETGGHSIEFL